MTRTAPHRPAPDPAGWLLVGGLILALAGTAGSRQDSNPAGTIGIQSPSYATSDSNDRMIAVTGIDVTGGSLLYIIDTQNRQLSVYQATGGTKSTMKVEWVGGRNIDLDLQVDGFNDKSQFSYKDLEAKFGAPDED